MAEVQNVWQLLRSLNEVCHFQTREGKRVGSASSSELKRWCQNQAVVINGKRVAWDHVIDYDLWSVALLPKNPITLL